jgi:phosphatidylinositol kinase/protein kinase (PI-3  family)
MITLLGSDNKEYQFRIEKRQSSLHSILSSQCVDLLNTHLELSRESFIRKLRMQEVKKVFVSEEVCLVPTSPHTITLLDILNDHMDNKTNYPEGYFDNDKNYQKLPRHEVTRMINKRMKDIVAENVLEQYFMDKATTLDDYYLFRKQFAYSYAPLQLLQYMFCNESMLGDYVIQLTTASISIDNFKVRT